GDQAIGLAPVSEQVVEMSPKLGVPVAAINGDFYERQGRYAGHPRGLQILEGELVSAPSGGAGSWLGGVAGGHGTRIVSSLSVTWANGETTQVGLNQERRTGQVVLFTPKLGESTQTSGGHELILERAGQSPWLPLRPGRAYRAKVREVRNAGN